MKISRKLNKVLRPVFYIGIAAGLVLSICPPKGSSHISSCSPAIASYNHFTTPKLRTSDSFSPADKDRFYPNYPRNPRLHGNANPKALKRYHNEMKDLMKPYQITSARNYEIRYLSPNYPIWSVPPRPCVAYTSSTNGLAAHNQAVELYRRAEKNGHVYFEIVSGGHIYGWVAKQALIKPQMYHLPFHYYSQLYPTKAPDACEAVALRMALSVKGHDPRMRMRDFINRIPRNNDPRKGYTANPYHYGDSASIYPQALSKYGKRYDKHCYAYTGISKHQIIKELKHGNPVVFEGSYLMKNISSDHTLVLIGYSKGYFQFADPYYRKSWKHKPISWVKTTTFYRIFHQSMRGARAVVIK